MTLNWLDWILLAVMAFSAVRGFMRGFVVEVCSLLGMVLGIWGAVHFSDLVAGWLGLGTDQEVLAFAATFFLLLLGVNLLGKAITTALDIAQLGLPNKLAGTLFAVVRSAFVLSVMLNIGLGNESQRAIPDHRSRKESKLYAPIRAFAPLLVPALDDTKWMKRAWKAMDKWEKDRAASTAPDPLEEEL